jgi:hypothetical protein
MNQRVPGLSWQARVKSTDLGLCANAGISAVEILGLTSVFGASQSRARIPDLRKSSQRALFRFAIFGVREPPISPYRNLPRLHRPSLAPLAEASASYEQTVRIALFRDGSTRRISYLCCFSVAPKKAERLRRRAALRSAPTPDASPAI